MHYSGPCGWVMTKSAIVYSSSRQAPLLNCFCTAQFPLDGKLDGKSMKCEAGKCLNHNNVQTIVLSQTKQPLVENYSGLHIMEP